jgi:hypothetical protein
MRFKNLLMDTNEDGFSRLFDFRFSEEDIRGRVQTLSIKISRI